MNIPISVQRRHMTVEGERVVLRTLTPENATEEYASWLNDPVVNQYLDTRSATVPELCDYIATMHESDSTLFFGIFWKENDEHIGNLKLEMIDWEAGSVTLGIIIGKKDYWGRGAATEAINLAVECAFRDLGLRSVNLGVLPENKSAIRVYEKCGFHIDRVEKLAAEYRGHPCDRIWMQKDVFGTIRS